MDETLVNLPDLRCELATMSMLSGIVENMVEFKGYFYLRQKSKGKITTVKNYHCIVMELMETNLEEIVHIKKEKLTGSYFFATKKKNKKKTKPKKSQKIDFRLLLAMIDCFLFPKNKKTNTIFPLYPHWLITV